MVKGSQDIWRILPSVCPDPLSNIQIRSAGKGAYKLRISGYQVPQDERMTNGRIFTTKYNKVPAVHTKKSIAFSWLVADTSPHSYEAVLMKFPIILP